MPNIVRKGGSIFILSTYVTAIALAVTYFLGGELLASHDNRNTMVHMQKSIDGVQDTMGEFIQFSNENRIVLTTHTVMITHCKERLDKCEERIDDGINGL